MARLATSSFPYKQVSHFLHIHLSMEKDISSELDNTSKSSEIFSNKKVFP